MVCHDKRTVSIFTALTIGLMLLPLAEVRATVSDDSLLRQYTSEAQQMYGAGNFSVAESKYFEALKLALKRPGSVKMQVVLLSNIGAALREQHKYPEAEASFKKAIALANSGHVLNDPVSITAMRQYALLLKKMHRTDEADALEGRADAAANRDASMPPIGLPSDSEPPSVTAGAGSPSTQSSFASTAGLLKGGAAASNSQSVDDLKKTLSKSPDSFATWIELVRKYYKAKDWPNAISTLQTMIRQFPDEGKKLHSPLAECFAMSGQYQDSIEELKRAIEIEPSNGDLYLTLYSTYVAAGDYRMATDTEETFIDKFPGHPKYGSVLEHYKYAKKDEEYQHEKQRVLGNKPLPTERKYAYPLKMFPLKVYIHNRYEDAIKLAPTSGLPEDTPTAIIQKSCDMWQQGSMNRVSFILVDRPEDAQIEVFFTNNPQGLEQGFAQGVTEQPGIGESKKRIRVLTVSQNGDALDAGGFLDTVLHEFGHALGLGHSGDIGDIMYPSLHPKRLCALSQTDCERVQKLYSGD